MNKQNNCQNRREAIASLILDELDSHDADKLKKHIDTCQTCQHLYKMLANEEEMIQAAFKSVKDRADTIQSKLIEQFDKQKLQSSSRGQTILHRTTGRSKIMKQITKIAAAAAMMTIAVLVGVSLLNGTSTWAKVMQAFNEVENVHLTQKMIMPDGTVQQHELWLRRPNCLYENYDRTIFIDNGLERLVIDKEEKTAQFSDSFMPFRPLEEHYMFDQIKLFRGKGHKRIEFAKLGDQSDETTLVFSLHYKYKYSTTEFVGKAWVDALTMLPLKIQVELTSEQKDNEPKSGEIIFSYEPIPDNVFAMVIPEGFTELPRKQRGVLSGRVLDENEQPVANAVVYVTDRVGNFSEQTLTDKSGRFNFKLPPEGMGKTVWLPVLFRAFVEGVPDTVAWSIIKDPANNDEPGGRIPYDVANVDNDRGILKSAAGITLRMEPAGTIAGQVTDTDGTPISNAKLQLLRCHLSDKHGNAGLFGIDVYKWSGPGELGIVRTDEYGWYELNNLPQLWKRTKIFVRAEAEGFVGDTSGFYAKGPIEYEELDFELYKAGITVTGTLIDNYGKPLDERDISARVNGKEYIRTKTDSKGEFALLNCPITDNLQIYAELSHNSWPPHETQRYRTYTYYPDLTVGIDYRDAQLKYDVEMVAQLPDLILNIVVKNTAGELLKYFSVEIRTDAAQISTQWKVEKKFTRRTDENGKCTFTDVPKVAGLKLVLYGDNRILNEKLSENEKIFVEENRKKYFWSEVPIEIRDDQKEYNITAVALTFDEYENQKDSHR